MFFYPKLIKTMNSKINGEVKVVKLLGTYRLIIGGYTQSGGIIRPIWKKALKSIKKKLKKEDLKILILGFGAGTAAKIANELWPKAKITGIEIDATVIDLAKKYFQIDEIKNLKVIKADAIKWVKKNAKYREQRQFDLILVDMYIGSNPAPETSSPEFLEALKNLLFEDGAVLFNRLIIKKQKAQIQEFRDILSEVFPKVEKIPTPANLIFITGKESNNKS